MAEDAAPETGDAKVDGGALPILLDKRGRPLRALRISVTDRCNFRCQYCMPRDVFGPDFEFMARDLLLSFEEIERVVSALTPLGLQKIRITGGEPLMRKELYKLISVLSKHDLDLALTTNGALLAKQAKSLADAGLDRITISFDAIDKETFHIMNDVKVDPLTVLKGIKAAEEAGLPVKINAVIRRGINEHSILELARYFHGTPHVLRFIEFMDVGQTNGWKMSEVVTAAEILATLATEFDLEPVAAHEVGDVAKRYRYTDGGGEIGIVTSVSMPFCGDCNRARITADGRLFTCLFSSDGFDTRSLIRGDSSEEEIASAISAIWHQRDDRYSELRTENTIRKPKVEMSTIGG